MPVLKKEKKETYFFADAKKCVYDILMLYSNYGWNYMLLNQLTFIKYFFSYFLDPLMTFNVLQKNCNRFQLKGGLIFF